MTSQPVDIHGPHQEFALIEVVRVVDRLELLLSGDLLIEDRPGVPRHTLKPSFSPVPNENSFDDPNASVACQSWIQKRRQKFSGPTSARDERHLKTLQDQAEDLRNSALNLKDLREQVLANKPRLLVIWRRNYEAPYIGQAEQITKETRSQPETTIHSYYAWPVLQIYLYLCTAPYPHPPSLTLAP